MIAADFAATSGATPSAILAVNAGQQANFRHRHLCRGNDIEILARGTDDATILIHGPVAEMGDLLGDG